MNHKQDIALLIKRNDWDRAEQVCQAEILRHPDDPETWFYLGAVQSAGGRRLEAIRSLKTAASYSANSTPSENGEPLLLRIAQGLLQLRSYAEALALFQRLSFALPQVVMGLGRCHWGLGEYELAMARFSGLWEAMPEWSELGLAYARALISLDRGVAAGAVLQQLLQRYPGEAELIQQYTLLLLSQQGVNAAYEWLNRHPAGTPSAKLVLIQKALTELASDVRAELRGEMGARLGSQWHSYQMLRQLSGEPRWFGENTALLQYATQQLPEGVVVECGVFHGRSLRLLHQWTKRPCHGFDSFSGLPEAWSAQEPVGAYSTGGRMPEMPTGVELHPGWFEQTLPGFAHQLRAQGQTIALLHVDCDLYSSSRTVLEHLMPLLAPGGVIVFDDFVGYPGWEEHEYRAWQEHLSHAGLPATELIGAVLLGRAAAFRLVHKKSTPVA